MEELVRVQLSEFITLGHCSHFTRTLYFHSPSARDNTDTTHEISRHIHADPCNKSYIPCRVVKQL